jgi:hypothetical protein
MHNILIKTCQITKYLLYFNWMDIKPFLNKIILLLLVFGYLFGLNSIFTNQIALDKAKALNSLNLNIAQSLAEVDSPFVGLNGYGALVLESGKDQRFIENLKIMNPKHYRFHDFIQQDAGENWRAFADDENQTWNRQKISDWADMIRLWRENGIDPEITVTIASFPKWMMKNTIAGQKLLAQSEYINYAKFVAELVKIINVEEGLGIENIEITNELDQQYGVKLEEANLQPKMDELATIYYESAKEIRKIDQSIKIGGPSFSRADKTNLIDQFLKKLADLNAKNYLNFISYHSYASGNLNDSDVDIFRRASGNIKFFNRSMLNLLEQNGFSSTKIYMNEFNISWVYTNNDPRMQNFKGAIFDALSLIEGLRQDIDQFTPWNDKDDIYGKMSNSFILRPSARVYELFSKNFSAGSVLNLDDNSEDYDSLLVKDDGKYKLLLVNKSPNNISLNMIRPNNYQLSKMLRFKTGLNQFQEASFNDQIDALSINYFEFSEIPALPSSSSSSSSSSSFNSNNSQANSSQFISSQSPSSNNSISLSLSNSSSVVSSLTTSANTNSSSLSNTSSVNSAFASSSNQSSVSSLLNSLTVSNQTQSSKFSNNSQYNSTSSNSSLISSQNSSLERQVNFAFSSFIEEDFLYLNLLNLNLNNQLLRNENIILTIQNPNNQNIKIQTNTDDVGNIKLKIKLNKKLVINKVEVNASNYVFLEGSPSDLSINGRYKIVSLNNNSKELFENKEIDFYLKNLTSNSILTRSGSQVINYSFLYISFSSLIYSVFIKFTNWKSFNIFKLKK